MNTRTGFDDKKTPSTLQEYMKVRHMREPQEEVPGLASWCAQLAAVSGWFLMDGDLHDSWKCTIDSRKRWVRHLSLENKGSDNRFIDGMEEQLLGKEDPYKLYPARKFGLRRRQNFRKYTPTNSII